MSTPDDTTNGSPADEVLTVPETAQLLKVHVETLARWRTRGIGPDWILLDSGGIRYERCAVRAYLANRTVAVGRAVA